MSTETVESTSIHNMDVPNIMHLGMGINILTIDPLNIQENCLPSLFDVNCTVPAPGTKWNKPVGTNLKMTPGGSEKTTSDLFMTAYDYSKSSANTIGVHAGFAGVFSCSESTSFKHFREDKGKHSSFLSYSRQVRNTYIASLELTDVDLKFSNVLQNDLKQLPDVYDYQTYATFIETHGTHFANWVQMGGIAQVYQKMSFNQYSTLTKKSVDIEASASGAFDEVSGGASVSHNQASSNFYKNTMSLSYSDLEYVGGETNSETLKSWTSTVDADPAPIKMKMQSISTICETAYAKSILDPFSLAKVSANLDQAVTEYCMLNGIGYVEELMYAKPVFRWRTGSEKFCYRYGFTAPEAIKVLYSTMEYYNEGFAFLAFDAKSKIAGTTVMNEFTHDGNYELRSALGDDGKAKGWVAARKALFSVPSKGSGYTVPVTQYNNAANFIEMYETTHDNCPQNQEYSDGGISFQAVSTQLKKIG